MRSKIILYHGSYKCFDRFSNKYHYSGNGKMVYGWGVYFSPMIDKAFGIATDIYSMGALNFTWLIDGKKIYNTHVNCKYEPFGVNYLDEPDFVTYKNFHQNWRTILIEKVKEKLNDIDSYYWLTSQEIKQIKKYSLFIIEKLTKAKEVKLFPHYGSFYIYTVEVAPRRIFMDGKITEKQRKAFNKQLAYEKHDFSISLDYKLNNRNSFYDYLESLFRKRYRYSKKQVNFNQMTSLFLYRAGYDIMYIPFPKEYVLFDITKAKILAIEKIGSVN